MNRYSMTQVEIITGIKAHTLRVWERRYSFMKAKRSNTNIRYYTDEDLLKLLQVSTLIKSGTKISKVDQMSEKEIEEEILSLHSKKHEDADFEINQFIIHTMNYDEAGFNALFDELIFQHGTLQSFSRFIYPFLNRIGIYWSLNKLIPAQEHFISNLIRQKLIASINNIPAPGVDSPSCVLFLPENEFHEIGLLLSSFIAKSLKWKVIYLGQNVPSANLKELIQATKANLFISFVVSKHIEKTASYFKDIASSNTPLLLSGPAHQFETEMEAFYEYVNSPDHLIKILKAKREEVIV